MPGPELSAVQRCCLGPRAHVLSLNTEGGSAVSPLRCQDRGVRAHGRGAARPSARDGRGRAHALILEYA